ncbi:hypothetical protein MEG_01241 [Bartonella tamiae Th307]|uniref:Uncharacterized protein n=1 Tax=Bartonella tamiae Th239 TaxID=1094558 RepID=J0ZQ72_9HYPH|nr:hypothetical protein ME5_00641 [Bartonella tamiae Th239]EJF93410.1 hypothetical protein MEG_01241 [Bartonella tamiae Th307]
MNQDCFLMSNNDIYKQADLHTYKQLITVQSVKFFAFTNV